MQASFNSLINSFIENKIGISENFLSVPLSQHLEENLTRLHTGKQMRSAGTGNDVKVLHNKLFRSDIIYWLDRRHNDQYENEFFDLMDDFVGYLNATCYTGITGYEFHYTLYKAGSFYKKHLDQFKNNDSRQYSMIMYLNKNWQENDGGELRIYHDDHVENIAPKNGKAVFFKSSDTEHEVLITHKPRLSITGWLKR